MVFKNGNIPWNKGIPWPEEVKRKISEKHKGKRLSKETRMKISLSLMGNKRGEGGRGRSLTEEHRRKLAKSKIRELNPQWKGNNVSMGGARNRINVPSSSRFIPVPEKHERHHIDGNPLNNAPENIAIVTRKQHMIDDGRMKKLIIRNKQKRRIKK